MINTQFQWQCHPEAERVLLKLLKECIEGNEAVQNLKISLEKSTSSRLFDWIDHFKALNSKELKEELNACGFEIESEDKEYQVLHHPGAQLPRVVLYHSESAKKGIAVSVESIAQFLMVQNLCRPIEGTPFGSLRSCLIKEENGQALFVIERRGTKGIKPEDLGQLHPFKYIKASEIWQTRPRLLEDEDKAFDAIDTCLKEMVALVGKEMTAWIILECERRYWECRNSAGSIQKGRQDRLGMGWANHDHHTFRSSRRHFKRLVHLFEQIGFSCRERFWAGAQAGWGAQVMENPNCKLVLFLDVDLTPEEIAIDFAHNDLPETSRLGTIGLWCGLHGDSILQAGMHHLEAQFLFEELRDDLGRSGIKMMDPFSNFPYLKQAFTQGETWPVAPFRIERLLNNGKITKEQAEKFLSQGALGSHMENLQRREGYKGFNQNNVSVIIKETDPRK